MDSDPWDVARLDLAGYLARVGVDAGEPTSALLDALHEAHVRTFTFDNVDVLLEPHPGVGLDAVQAKFVGRGRGGYCFEHSTLFAAVLQRLGYDVRRRLGRVGDPEAGTQQGRTHMVVEVVLDGRRLLCDPGFGMSRLRPIALADGAEDDYGGWPYRVRRTPGGWALDRRHDGAWQVTHTTDELDVLPVDIAMGHHWTSTYPGSHFRTSLTVARHLPGRHVVVTDETVTIRVPGEPTEHRELGDGEIGDWLAALGPALTEDEQRRLLTRVTELRSTSG